MLRVQSISFGYNEELVLKDVSFSVLKGQHISLIGESGSGKSTLLKAIYGLTDLQKGKIFWKAHQVLGPAYHLVPGMDNMKYLAQDFDLMPYVTVAENVGRFLSNFYLQKKADRINELLDLVGMREFAKVQARYLSGGQMQRVALARVLAVEPELLLLDEPFSHIDFHQKNELAQKVFNYCKQKGITIIYTSHTPDEILMFSDQIIVMKDGEIVDNDSPYNIYHLPSTAYTATLTGEVNLIPVSYFGVQNDELLLVRPQHLSLATTGIKGKVINSYFQGSSFLIKVMVDQHLFSFCHHESLKPDALVYLELIKKAASIETAS